MIETHNSLRRPNASRHAWLQGGVLTAASAASLVALATGALALLPGIAPAADAPAALAPATPPMASAAAEDPPAASLRLREGTQLSDRVGHFRQHGESVTFVDGEGRELGGLPNLNLERVLRMLKSVEEPESVMWSVSGTVTEFAGLNYLLVSRAVYKAASLPPAPEAVE